MRTMRGLFILVASVAVSCGTQPATTPPPTKQADAHSAMPDMADLPAARAGQAGPSRRRPPAHQIVIDNFAFDPTELTVPVGTEVTWVNHDDVPHTATSTAKPKAFDSGALDTDQTYSHVFTTAGEYEYFCAVHPHMTGKVVVK